MRARRAIFFNMKPNPIIFPVVMAVPTHAQSMSGRPKVDFLSRHARKALNLSARKSQLTLKSLPKDPNGSPLPSAGVYWSISHKPLYVAGVASTSPIGIDVEPITPRKTTGLFFKVADEGEWGLAGGPSWHDFYRFWTAKEAVLKAAGIGLKELSQCRIHQILDNTRLTVAYNGRIWQVVHTFFDGHIASLVHQAQAVEWTFS